MSSILHAYVVNLPKLATVVGSKQKKFVKQVANTKLYGQRFASRWKKIDEELGEDEPTIITCLEALDDLVMGTKWRRGADHIYKYVLQDLCRLYGRAAAEHATGRSELEIVSHRMLGDFDEVLSKARCTNVLGELYRSQRKLAPVPAFKNDGDAQAAFVPFAPCTKARQELLDGIGKIKPPWRVSALEIYTWLGEIGPDDALALFLY